MPKPVSRRLPVEHKPAVVQLPYYIDPSVLRPGVIVYDTLEGDRTPLEVLRVEPVLVCKRPDGVVVEVYAHLAQLEPEAEAKRIWQKYCATHTLPAGVPTNPDEVYAEWQGWCDWIGRAVPEHPGPDCDCDMCRSRIP